MKRILKSLFLLAFVTLGLSQATPSFAAAFTVIGLGDAGGTCPTPATCASLRQAINSTNAAAGADTVTFTVNGTITLGSALPTITQALSITGPALPLTINANGGNKIFTLNPGVGNLVTLSNLNLTGVNIGLALTDGGAITVTSGNLNLNHSAVYNNVLNNVIVLGSGAGLANNSTGTLTITNTTFSGNNARNDGGAIRSNSGTVVINNSTIVNNVAQDDGGGISQGGGTITLSNTILANNTNNGAGTSPNCNGTVTSADYNLIEDTTGCTIGGTTTNNIVGQDPLLGALTNNGGATLTHALLISSPAIGEANPAAVGAAPACQADDQLFVTRPQGTVCDIGAYEFPLAPPTTGDVSVTNELTTPASGNPDVGDAITYTVVVTNNGPNTVSNVRVTDQLTGPADFDLTSVTTSQGVCAPTGPATLNFPFAIVCDLGTMANAATVTVTVNGTINAPGSITSTAVALPLTSIDFNLTNNTAAVALTTETPAGTGAITVPVADPFVFAATDVGDEITQIFTLTESDGADLYVFSVALSDNTDYRIVNDECSGVTINSSSCDVEVAFAPQSVNASLTSTLIFATNASSPAGGLVSRALEGAGTADALAVAAPASLAFGNVTVGTSSQAKTVQLTNQGSTVLTFSADPTIDPAGDFTILNQTCTVAGAGTLNPGEDCLVEVIFTPSSTAAQPATDLEFTSDGGNPTVALTGLGITGPLAVADPTTLAFGNVGVGSSSDALVAHLSNTGTTDLTITANPVITGSTDFAIVNAGNACVNGTVLVPGQDCVIQVAYSPTAAGAAGPTTLDFTTDGGNPQVTLTGTGVVGPNAVADPTTLAFGNVGVGSSSDALVAHLSNTGTTDLTITANPAITGSADFAIVNAGNACVNGTVLVPGQDCVIQVVYSPSAAGAATATTLDFTTDGGNPQVTLTGTGVVGPISSAAPDPLAFGNVAVGTTSASKTVQLTNTGTTLLTFSADPVIAGGGEFSIINQTCTVAGVGTLSPGEDCLVQVVFSPTSTAAQPATTLDFTDDGGSDSVALTGLGVVGPVSSAAPDPLDFGNIAVGSTSETKVVQLTNTGTTLLTFSADPAINGGGEFSIINQTCTVAGAGTLSPGEDCLVQVVFSPTSTAVQPATTLDFTDDGGNASVDLTGLGVVGPISSAAPDPLAFGSVAVGMTSEAKVVQLTNTGTTTLNFSADPAINGGGEFEINNQTCTTAGVGSLEPGEDCLVEVVFAPTSTAAQPATTLDFTDDGGNASVDLTGLGVDTAADLTVVKTVDVAQADIGDTVTFTLTVENNGPAATTNTQLTDTLTAAVGTFTLDDVIFTTGSGTCNPSVFPVGSPVIITCDLDSIANGGSVVIEVVGTVTGLGEIHNNVSVFDTADGTTPSTFDPNQSNNSSGASVNGTSEADLGITKVVSGPSTVNIGDTVTLEVTIDNDGPNDATNVRFRDIQLGGLSFDDTSLIPGTCSVSGNILDCVLTDPIADGGSVTFTFTMIADVAGFWSDIATVSSEVEDHQIANNTTGTQIAVEVVPFSADLEVSKSANVSTVLAGGSIVYTITVDNNGPDDAEQVVVTDFMSAGNAGTIANVTGINITGGNCAPFSSGLISCLVPTIANGNSATLTYTVLTGTAGTINNIVTVGGQVSDPDGSNNVATETVEVTPALADLAIVKEVGPNPVVQPGTVTYTLTVTNAGPDEAENVRVLDQISGTASNITASATDGGTCTVAATSATTNAVSCELGTMSPDAADASNEIVITITITASGNLVTYSNIASVMSDTLDPNMANNFATADVVGADADLVNFSSGCGCAYDRPTVPGASFVHVGVVLVALGGALSLRRWARRRERM